MFNPVFLISPSQASERKAKQKEQFDFEQIGPGKLYVEYSRIRVAYIW